MVNSTFRFAILIKPVFKCLNFVNVFILACIFESYTLLLEEICMYLFLFLLVCIFFSSYLIRFTRVVLLVLFSVPFLGYIDIFCAFIFTTSSMFLLEFLSSAYTASILCLIIFPFFSDNENIKIMYSPIRCCRDCVIDSNMQYFMNPPKPTSNVKKARKQILLSFPSQF